MVAGRRVPEPDRELASLCKSDAADWPADEGARIRTRSRENSMCVNPRASEFEKGFYCLGNRTGLELSKWPLDKNLRIWETRDWFVKGFLSGSLIRFYETGDVPVNSTGRESPLSAVVVYPVTEKGFAATGWRKFPLFSRGASAGESRSRQSRRPIPKTLSLSVQQVRFGLTAWLLSGGPKTTFPAALATLRAMSASRCYVGHISWSAHRYTVRVERGETRTWWIVMSC
jgi:hypothetical protein